VIANVDADKYKDLGEKYGVSGFPTLKFFPKTNKAGEDYDGGCDLDAFVAFINEKALTNRDGQGRLTSLVRSTTFTKYCSFLLRNIYSIF